MLNQKTIDIVKSTAPVLQQHGELLTTHFYKRMFTHNPEVAPFFNPSNQAAGVQQRALAGAICAYAANIDNLEVLGGAVELIAQKHASLMIKAEHYPIVGANLLASIREVLGAGATDEVIAAWAEAYGFLAEILIGREIQIYRANREQTGGWEGFRNFTIDRKEVESDNITSFYLKPADGGQVPAYMPGQYITVRVATPDDSTTMRNYSLSDKPGQGYFRISVKREDGPGAQTPQGYVSNLLHSQKDVGDSVELGPPCGEFYLDISEQHERPLVLLAGGIGITPIFSMLLAASESMPNRRIILVYASINEKVQAFKQAIDELARRTPNLRVHYRYSEACAPSELPDENCSSGFVTAELIESLVPERDADYYFCGPKPFMIGIYQDLLSWGIPANQVHFEFFGPKQELESSSAAEQ